MIKRFLGREHKGGEPHPEPFPAGVACGAGCTNSEGYRCEYVDTTGAQCGWWCRNHAVFVDGLPWCRRHASVVKWLRAKEEDQSGRRIFAAAVDDRSPTLVAFIVDALDVEVSEHLRKTFAVHHNARIATDDEVRSASIAPPDVEPGTGAGGRQQAWERGWGAYTDVGVLTRVVLRATATEPPVVHLYVNGRHALSRTPDWIANRGSGTDATADREAFGRAVMDSVMQNVSLEG